MGGGGGGLGGGWGGGGNTSPLKTTAWEASEAPASEDVIHPTCEDTINMTDT